jgi:hypothetical protein
MVIHQGKEDDHEADNEDNGNHTDYDSSLFGTKCFDNSV